MSILSDLGRAIPVDALSNLLSVSDQTNALKRQDRLDVLEAEKMRDRILEHKRRLGGRLVILGHYYQRDEVVEFADFQGDSFELAKRGAAADAEHIVFCGVRFMAEAASILAKREQRVYLPAMDAGCPLADMADIGQARAAWEALGRAGVAGEFMPVVYMNSSAAIKAF